MQNVEKNKNGLKSLMKAGIHLRAMNEDSWEELASSIDVDLDNSDKYEKDKERVKTRDNGTRAVLQALQDEIDAEEELAAGLESLSLYKDEELSDEETTDQETEDDQSTDDESTDDESTDEECTDEESTDEEIQLHMRRNQLKFSKV